MDHVLTATPEIDQPPREFLECIGVIFEVFGPETQDSGNLSYGIDSAGARFFVKTTDPNATVFLDYRARVELLRNAVRVSRSCDNAVLPRLHNVIESPHGPMLIYEWTDGDLLRNESARQRVRRLPDQEILTSLDQIFQLHVDLADAGWVAADFYDGCLIYDFSLRELHVVDLDGYPQGPFRNSMGRMFGSSRFMAPEEFEYGRLIDQRTTVFTLGRTAAVLFSDGTLGRGSFRGGEALYEVMVQACQPLPEHRFESVRQFCTAWQRAR
jgi:serine/threonine-protein kinase